VRGRAQLLASLRALLIAHDRAEEEHVYPAIVKADPGKREQIQQSGKKHESAEHLLDRLEKIDPESEQFDQMLGRLVDVVTAYLREEEAEVLPTLRDMVDEAESRRLGELFAKRRDQEINTAAGKRFPADETDTKRQAPSPAAMAGNRRPPAARR
jgi:hemerythrin superfamily protein